jgi:hypothetical protein
MDPELLRKLRGQAAEIGERWDALLRLERMTGPLAHPDALVHLIADSMRQVFAVAASARTGSLSIRTAMADSLPGCECGHNPYLMYFIAGEQALIEAVIRAQADLPPHRRRESDIAAVIQAVRSLGHAEIDTFCGICAHHGTAARCRHAARP